MKKVDLESVFRKLHICSCYKSSKKRTQKQEKESEIKPKMTDTLTVGLPFLEKYPYKGSKNVENNKKSPKLDFVHF